MRPQMHDARIRRDQGVKALHSMNQTGPVGFSAKIFNLFLNFRGQQTQKLARGGLLRRRAQQANTRAVQQAEKGLQHFAQQGQRQ